MTGPGSGEAWAAAFERVNGGDAEGEAFHGAALGKSNPPDDGWIRVDALDAAGWEALRARVESSAMRFSGAVRRLNEAEYASRADLLRFLLHHDLSHGGQVALLGRARRAGTVPEE